MSEHAASAPRLGASLAMSRRAIGLSLGMIVVIGGALRFVGIGWGLSQGAVDGYHLPYHPDEATMTFTALRQMNPRALDFNPEIAHSEGTLFYYILAVTEVAASATGHVRLMDAAYYQEHPDQLSRVVIVGRAISALAGLAAVLAMIWLGSELGGAAVGLVAGLLMAVTPIEVLSSHFARPHTLLDALLILLFVFAWRYRRDGNFRDLWVGAVLVGLLSSTRYPMALSFCALVTAEIARKQAWPVVLRRLAVGGAIALGTLLITCPYLLLDPASVMAGQKRVSHWSGLPKFDEMAAELYLRLVVVPDAAITLPIAIVSVAGLAFLVKRRMPAGLFMAPWFVIYSLLTVVSPAGREAARWMQPVLPVLLIAAAFLIVHLGRTYAGKWGYALKGALALTIMYPLCVSLSHAVALRARDPRLEARDWIARNLPSGATIAIGRAPDGFGVGVNSHLRHRILVTNEDYQPYPPIPAERDVPRLDLERPRWYLVADWQFEKYPGLSYRRAMSEAKFQRLFGPQAHYEVAAVFARPLSAFMLPLPGRIRVAEEYIVAPRVYLLRRREEN